MQRERPRIGSESDFFQEVRSLSTGRIYFERVEPKDESGFPDTYFVLKDFPGVEGTIEFKFSRSPTTQIGTMLRPTQRVRAFEYYEAGGTRYFGLLYNPTGAWLFDSREMAMAALRKSVSGCLVSEQTGPILHVGKLVNLLRQGLRK